MEHMIKQHPTIVGIAADELGNVYRLKKGKWVTKKHGKNIYGYFQINVANRTRKVHQLIYECCMQTIPVYSTATGYGAVINHINGIKTDNRINNLELTTNRRNIQLALPTKPLPSSRIDRIYRNTITGAIYVAPMDTLSKRHGRKFYNSTYQPSHRSVDIEYLGKLSDLK